MSELKYQAKRLARFMHNDYERIAKKNNWNTQKKCKVSFSNLPIENKLTMIEVAQNIIKWVLDLGVEGHDDFFNYICINKSLIEEEELEEKSSKEKEE